MQTFMCPNHRYRIKRTFKSLSLCFTLGVSWPPKDCAIKILFSFLLFFIVYYLTFGDVDFFLIDCFLYCILEYSQCYFLLAIYFWGDFLYIVNLLISVFLELKFFIFLFVNSYIFYVAATEVVTAQYSSLCEKSLKIQMCINKLFFT